VGTSRVRRPARYRELCTRKLAIAACPWYSSVAGGMVNQASSVSSATTPATSSSA